MGASRVTPTGVGVSGGRGERGARGVLGCPLTAALGEPIHWTIQCGQGGGAQPILHQKGGREEREKGERRGRGGREGGREERGKGKREREVGKERERKGRGKGKRRKGWEGGRKGREIVSVDP